MYMYITITYVEVKSSRGALGGSVEPPLAHSLVWKIPIWTFTFAQKYLSGNLRTPARTPLHRILDLPQTGIVREEIIPLCNCKLCKYVRKSHCDDERSRCYHYRSLARLWECSQSGGQNKRNFRICQKNLIVLYSRLAAFPQMCKGSIQHCQSIKYVIQIHC